MISLNTGKYGPEKTSYLDTFLAVFVESECEWCSLLPRKQEVTVKWAFNFLIHTSKLAYTGALVLNLYLISK